MKIKRRKFLQFAITLPALGYLTEGIESQNQSETQSEEVEKLIELVNLRHKVKFTDEQLKMLKEEIESNIRRRERLLNFKLSNWDEPDFKFQV